MKFIVFGNEEVSHREVKLSICIYNDGLGYIESNPNNLVTITHGVRRPRVPDDLDDDVVFDTRTQRTARSTHWGLIFFRDFAGSRCEVKFSAVENLWNLFRFFNDLNHLYCITHWNVCSNKIGVDKMRRSISSEGIRRDLSLYCWDWPHWIRPEILDNLHDDVVFITRRLEDGVHAACVVIN